MYSSGSISKMPRCPKDALMGNVHPGAVSLLVVLGAEVNFVDSETGDSPLLIACKNAPFKVCLPLVRSLLQASSHVNHQNLRGYNALAICIEKYRVDVAVEILSWGANIEDANKVLKEDVLHVALYRAEQTGNTRLLTELVANGALNTFPSLVGQSGLVRDAIAEGKERFDRFILSVQHQLTDFLPRVLRDITIAYLLLYIPTDAPFLPRSFSSLGSPIRRTPPPVGYSTFPRSYSYSFSYAHGPAAPNTNGHPPRGALSTPTSPVRHSDNSQVYSLDDDDLPGADIKVKSRTLPHSGLHSPSPLHSPSSSPGPPISFQSPISSPSPSIEQSGSIDSVGLLIGVEEVKKLSQERSHQERSQNLLQERSQERSLQDSQGSQSASSSSSLREVVHAATIDPSLGVEFSTPKRKDRRQDVQENPPAIHILVDSLDSLPQWQIAS
jgi:ankyrin repeat protein